MTRSKKALIFGVFFLLLLEVGSRSYLAFTMDASWIAPGDAILKFYPEVEEVRQATPIPGDPARVLVLGGSVVARGEQDINSVLLERLKQKSDRPIQLFNVAADAHMTLDSARKYRLLGDQRFDLVIFYHGINDVRANLCPDHVFRQDYSHMLWHRIIHRLEAHPELSILAHPYVVHLLAATISERLWPPTLIPTRSLDGQVSPEGKNVEAWQRYGAKVKTRSSFASNVEAVVRLARRRGEPLLLMTFAAYPAPGYSFARFRAKNLDYDRHWVPTEVWGAPGDVSPAVDAHNEVVRGIARKHPGVHFLDMARAIPHGRVNFDDICHLSMQGKRAWVDAMLDTAVEALKKGQRKK